MDTKLLIHHYEDYLTEKLTHLSLCDRCGMLDPHGLQYCYECPGKFNKVVITRREYIEANYRKGRGVYTSGYGFANFLQRKYPDRKDFLSEEENKIISNYCRENICVK